MLTAFSRALKRARRQNGLTKQDCAKLLGINQGRYVAYERGSRVPPMEHVTQLSLLFGTQFDEYYPPLLADFRRILRERLPRLSNKTRSKALQKNRQSALGKMLKRIKDNPDNHDA